MAWAIACNSNMLVEHDCRLNNSRLYSAKVVIVVVCTDQVTFSETGATHYIPADRTRAAFTPPLPVAPPAYTSCTPMDTR